MSFHRHLHLGIKIGLGRSLAEEKGNSGSCLRSGTLFSGAEISSLEELSFSSAALTNPPSFISLNYNLFLLKELDVKAVGVFNGEKGRGWCLNGATMYRET